MKNDLYYWVEWQFQQGKFVESKEAIEKWPGLVLNFLESSLQWPNIDLVQTRVNVSERRPKIKGNYFHGFGRLEYSLKSKENNSSKLQAYILNS